MSGQSAYPDRGSRMHAHQTSEQTGNGVQTRFTLPAQPFGADGLQVYVNGSRRARSTYTWSGTVVTFSAAPGAGQSVIFDILS